MCRSREDRPLEARPGSPGRRRTPRYRGLRSLFPPASSGGNPLTPAVSSTLSGTAWTRVGRESCCAFWVRRMPPLLPFSLSLAGRGLVPAAPPFPARVQSLGRVPCYLSKSRAGEGTLARCSVPQLLPFHPPVKGEVAGCPPPTAPSTSPVCKGTVARYPHPPPAPSSFPTPVESPGCVPLHFRRP